MTEPEWERSDPSDLGDTAERPPLPFNEEVPGKRAAGRRRSAPRRRSRIPGCLAVLVALVVILGGGYFVVSKGVHKLKDQFSSTPDYASGTETGKTTFEVKSGDTVAVMGRNLKKDGIVESVDAFIAAAQSDPDSSKIQAGFYGMQKHMSAADALHVLTDPKNIVTTTVAIPEGLRVKDVEALLAKKTGKPKSAFDAALKDPRIGLPDFANGNPEGYLFPATYSFGPQEQPVDMIADMVKRWKQAADADGLVAGAQKLGFTPEQVMNVASLVQAEGRGSAMPKVARVIYNRLTGPGDKEGTNGLLQVDATVNYALDRTGVATTTTQDLKVDSPYNTYLHPGLPPTPISNPGDDAIKAALNPTPGDWYYYITVNLKTGETKFAKTYQEFLGYRAELKHYCDTESAGAC